MGVKEATLHHMNIAATNDATDVMHDALDYIEDGLRQQRQCEQFEEARSMIACEEFLGMLKKLDSMQLTELRHQLEARLAVTLLSEHVAPDGDDPWVGPTHPMTDCALHRSLKEFFWQLATLGLVPNVGSEHQPLTYLFDTDSSPQTPVHLADIVNWSGHEIPTNSAVLRLAGCYTVTRKDGAVCLRYVDLFINDGITRISEEEDGTIVYDGLCMEVGPGEGYASRHIVAAVAPDKLTATLRLR